MEKGHRAEALATIVKDMTRQAQNVERYADQVERLEMAMDRTFVDSYWDVRYQNHLRINSLDLPLIRKVVGRMKVTGKVLTYDYDKTGEIIVMVKPCSKDFDMLSFHYRRKFRNGGKCKVIEQTTTQQTLVCQA